MKSGLKPPTKVSSSNFSLPSRPVAIAKTAKFVKSKESDKAASASDGELPESKNVLAKAAISASLGSNTTPIFSVPQTAPSASLKRKLVDDVPMDSSRNIRQRTEIENPKTVVSERSRGTIMSTSRDGTVARNGKAVVSRVNSNPPFSKATGKKPAPNDDKPVETPKKKKRAPYDTKGRLEDMEELTTYLKSKLGSSSGRMSDLETKSREDDLEITKLKQANLALEHELSFKDRERSGAEKHVDDLKLELQKSKSQYETELAYLNTSHDLKVKQLNMESASLKLHLERVEQELQLARDESSGLKSTLNTQSSTVVVLESEQRAFKSKLDVSERQLISREGIISELEKSLQAANNLADSLESKLREEETMRRKLHNTIQELKGNIRVFCRVRPLLPGEATSMDHIDITPSTAAGESESIELTTSAESASGNTISKGYPFSFDKVFGPKSTQIEVFDEISQLVQSALDGYNVCIFAYGQTGSGKTHTMTGPENFLTEKREEMGMIPRSIYQIFETAKRLEAKGWKYELQGQFLEIYNEAYRDLLADKEKKQLDVKHANGRTTVSDAVVVQLVSPDEVQSLLEKANKNRAVGATNCNERSSRSHSVFTLRLTGTNALTAETSEGVLNLIDLAGSERLSSSGSTGDRLKETQAINKSLSSLGDVIYSLANKDQHIPYRNSKLTWLLMNSLGGNSKTLMFVNVNSDPGSFNESLNSLRFATKVNSCQIGTATKKIATAKCA